ncbi:hypothetical protein TKWG_17140 [Advenella kashmirensis WT001]|uniref:Uncharacterized protein n=1 Tax=Advenella kashmirensis (strain DSM 17095 / LMG 22695 / WT001) TaxID=1036672 RepID=I3UEA4_ADVKW|nr:hypothetical protein TKWG_17140 [Advenella kashmirensis WT001]
MAPAVPVSQYRRTCCANPLFLTDANAAVTTWLADVLRQASLACSAWHLPVRQRQMLRRGYLAPF